MSVDVVSLDDVDMVCVLVEHDDVELLDSLTLLMLLEDVVTDWLLVEVLIDKLLADDSLSSCLPRTTNVYQTKPSTALNRMRCDTPS